MEPNRETHPAEYEAWTEIHLGSLLSDPCTLSAHLGHDRSGPVLIVRCAGCTTAPIPLDERCAEEIFNVVLGHVPDDESDALGTAMEATHR